MPYPPVHGGAVGTLLLDRTVRYPTANGTSRRLIGSPMAASSVTLHKCTGAPNVCTDARHLGRVLPNVEFAFDRSVVASR